MKGRSIGPPSGRSVFALTIEAAGPRAGRGVRGCSDLFPLCSRFEELKRPAPLPAGVCGGGNQ